MLVFTLKLQGIHMKELTNVQFHRDANGYLFNHRIVITFPPMQTGSVMFSGSAYGEPDDLDEKVGEGHASRSSLFWFLMVQLVMDVLTNHMMVIQ